MCAEEIFLLVELIFKFSFGIELIEVIINNDDFVPGAIKFILEMCAEEIFLLVDIKIIRVKLDSVPCYREVPPNREVPLGNLAIAKFLRIAKFL
jgi:hypothetical protein